MSKSCCSQGKKPARLHSSDCKIVVQISFKIPVTIGKRLDETEMKDQTLEKMDTAIEQVQQEVDSGCEPSY